MGSRDRLTKLQRMALDYIVACVEATGAAPTTVELMEGLMLSNKTDAYGLVTTLMRKGYVAWERGRTRGISVLRRSGGEPFLVHR